MTASGLRLAAGLFFVLAWLVAVPVTKAWPAAPVGLPAIDASQPIAINADSFLADLNSETGLYTGNVIVTQGTVRLHADRVKVSAPGGKASRVEADGHVVVDTPSGQAVGDTGVYEVVEQLLRLTGNVVLTKDANVMRGSALEVSMATGMAHLTAGGEGALPGQSTGRVQGLFVPNRGANAPTPPAATPPPGRGNPPKP
jgi:lipopolysaccharide export system protein LptA